MTWISHLVGPDEPDVVGTELGPADQLPGLQDVRGVDGPGGEDLGLPQQHHADRLGGENRREAALEMRKLVSWSSE